MERQWDGSIEEDNIENYRPLSIVGILSFLLGLISCFAIYIPGVGIVGVVAILLGIIAVVTSRNQPRSLGSLAYVGVFLSILSISWSVAVHANYNNRLLRTASDFGEQWLHMIADDKLNEAICLRMEYLDRPLEGTDLEAYFEQEERPKDTASGMPAPANLKKMFTEKQTVRNMIISGKDTRIRPTPEKDRVSGSDRGIAKILVTYDVDMKLGGNYETVSLEVEIYRVRYNSGVQWQVKELINLSRSDLPVGGPIRGDGSTLN